MEQTSKFDESVSKFAAVIRVGKNMDAKEGEILLCERRCHFFYLEGFLNKQALERVFSAACISAPNKTQPPNSALDFVKSHLPFAECTNISNDEAVLRLLSGFLILLIEGFEKEFLCIEVRNTPQRGIEEPSKGKTLRGPHEGFCENIVTNLALLRRRIKSTQFCAKEIVVGEQTQTRVALCYLDGVADEKIVQSLEKKLRAIQTPSVSLGEETVVEQLFYKEKRYFLNPLPRARLSERPDTCCAELMEGKIVLLIDTTPNAILLPISLFDYLEECDDYYFPPLTATYLRLVRLLGFLVSVFLVPIWLLAVNLTIELPESFSFVHVTVPYSVPIYLQLLLIELSIDSLKLASLNTPDPLTNSLSVVGGLLLGDFAVKSGWFIPQTILYSAIVTILNFLPNNYELGYSLKFARILLIVAVQLFGLYGLLGGTLLLLFFTAMMKDAAGQGYLYPFFPLSFDGIRKLLFRSIRGKEIYAQKKKHR